MADIGKSTNAHTSDTSIQLERMLENWGNWTAWLKDPSDLGIDMQPMFKEYVSGYRKSGASRRPECADSAELLDEYIARLDPRYMNCLIAHYVLRLSNVKAAQFMKRRDAEKGNTGYLSCSDVTYKKWLELAEANIENAIDGLDILLIDRPSARNIYKNAI